MRITVLAVMLLAASSGAGLAEPIRVDFSGHVTAVLATGPDISDPVAAIGGSVQVGTLFSGFFTFDDGAAPSNINDEVIDPEDPLPAQWTYEFSSTQFAYHTQLGAFSTDPMAGSSFGVELDDWEQATPPDSDEVRVTAQLAPYPPSPGPLVGPVYVFLILKGGSPGEPLHSTALSSVPWSLAAFPDQSTYDAISWQFFDGGGNIVYVQGSLDSLSAVPEPAAGSSLAALAAFALLALRNRCDTAREAR